MPSKIVMTGNKAEQSTVYHHSGFPGGLKKASYASVLATRPERIIEKAIKGMVPHNTLGRQMLSKLKVYAGPEHPHAAQGPQALHAAPGLAAAGPLTHPARRPHI